MVAPIYSNKKGIYKNLYLEIDSENKKKKAAETSYYKKSHKGIYRDLYKQLTWFEGSDDSRENPLITQILQSAQTTLSSYFSRMSYFFSSASNLLKMFMLACIIAKKPVSNYIENNINYENQGYYNDGQS